jgi:hypothetical protein
VPSTAAPADEYFGRLQMSPLGIVNAIRLVSARRSARVLAASDAMSGLGLVEDSIRDWEARFPSDPWLPRVLLDLGRTYELFDGSDARRKALDVAQWMSATYRATGEATLLCRELGVPLDADGARLSAEAAGADAVPAALRP